MMKQENMYCGWTLLGKTNESTLKAWDLVLLALIPSIEKPRVLKEKQLLSHLRYDYLREFYTLPIIISSYLSQVEEENPLRVLSEHNEVIGWSLDNIKGIRSSMCMHLIIL